MTDLVIHIRHPRWALLTRCGTCVVGNAWTRNLYVSTCKTCFRRERRAQNRPYQRNGGPYMLCRKRDRGCGFHTYRLPEASRDCPRCGKRLYLRGEHIAMPLLPQRAKPKRAPKPKPTPKTSLPARVGKAVFRCACGDVLFESERGAHACARAAA